MQIILALSSFPQPWLKKLKNSLWHNFVFSSRIVSISTAQKEHFNCKPRLTRRKTINWQWTNSHATLICQQNFNNFSFNHQMKLVALMSSRAPTGDAFKADGFVTETTTVATDSTKQNAHQLSVIQSNSSNAPRNIAWRPNGNVTVNSTAPTALTRR